MATAHPPDFHELLATPDPPELGPGPRGGVLSERAVNQAVDQAKKGRALSTERLELVRALALLWHDHHDSAHRIVQDLDNADGSMIHAILHRREPDYGNAGYWFRRVGRHGAFPLITCEVAELLKGGDESGFARRVLPAGDWDPLGMLELCREFNRPGTRSESQRQVREIQATESRVLLKWFFR